MKKQKYTQQEQKNQKQDQTVNFQVIDAIFWLVSLS